MLEDGTLNRSLHSRCCHGFEMADGVVAGIARGWLRWGLAETLIKGHGRLAVPRRGLFCWMPTSWSRRIPHHRRNSKRPLNLICYFGQVATRPGQ